MKKNSLKLTLTLVFSEDAEVTAKDKKQIIKNVIDSLAHTINSGGGIAPEDPEKGDYITEFIDVEGGNGRIVYNCKTQKTHLD